MFTQLKLSSDQTCFYRNNAKKFQEIDEIFEKYIKVWDKVKGSSSEKFQQVVERLQKHHGFTEKEIQEYLNLKKSSINFTELTIRKIKGNVDNIICLNTPKRPKIHETKSTSNYGQRSLSYDLRKQKIDHKIGLNLLVNGIVFTSSEREFFLQRFRDQSINHAPPNNNHELIKFVESHPEIISELNEMKAIKNT